MRKFVTVYVICLLSFGSMSAPARESFQESEGLHISVQSRIPSDLDSGAYILVNEIRHWKPEETVILNPGKPTKQEDNLKQKAA